jgi:hypothetical protein
MEIVRVLRDEGNAPVAVDVSHRHSRGKRVTRGMCKDVTNDELAKSVLGLVRWRAHRAYLARCMVSPREGTSGMLGKLHTSPYIW